MIESGLSYTAVDTPLTTITVEGAAGFTAETHVRSLAPTVVAAPDQHFAVASGTFGFWQKMTSMSELRNDVSVTADLVSATNWRMTDNLNFQITLTRLLIRHCRHGIHLTNRNRNVSISNCHIYQNRGIGVFEPIGGGREFIASDLLNPQQRKAVEVVLSSRDLAVAISGAAGTGKTATLRELKRIT